MTLVADWNASVNVPFQRMRQQLLDGALQEGVVGASDLMVVQRGAGVNQSVDVGTGFAWVQVDTGTRNGMGHVTNDATANVVLTAANGTNPRIDQIILRWNDSSIPTGSGNVPTLEVLTGTATSGATLANRTGAAALPNDCLRLADVLVPTSSTTVSNTQIRDRRPWARGAFYNTVITAGNISLVSTTYAATGSLANTLARIECSGVPIRLTAQVANQIPDAQNAGFAPFVDGAVPAGYDAVMNAGADIASGTLNLGFTMSWTLTPSAGSHTFQLVAKVAGGTLTILANATNALIWTIEEIVRPNTANNTTTSG